MNDELNPWYDSALAEVLQDISKDEDISQELKDAISEFEQARDDFLQRQGFIKVKSAPIFWEPVGWKPL